MKKLLYSECIFLMTLIERTPPSRGGFLFTMFPRQEPVGRTVSAFSFTPILRSQYARVYTEFVQKNARF